MDDIPTLLLFDLRDSRTSTALKLSKEDGLSVRLPESASDAVYFPADGNHPSYALPDFQSVAPIAISVLNLAIGLVSLSKVLYERQKELDKSRKKNAKEVYIQVGENKLFISDMRTADQVLALLRTLMDVSKKKK